MLRAAALSLLILASVALTLPLVDSSAHNSGRATASRRSHMRHRHSRSWWRRYRARLRRQREVAKRRQALQKTKGQSLNAASESHKNSTPDVKLAPATNDYKPSASALSLPQGWVRRSSAGANGEMKFVVSAADGQYIGGATIAPVNARPAGGMMMSASNRKALGGVPLADLRRVVIDKMIAENGWVVNDLRREVDGKPVFIVLAQTAASSDGRTPQLSWVFYFTEVDGRIYSLAASSLQEFSDRVADESAQLVASFLAKSR